MVAKAKISKKAQDAVNEVFKRYVEMPPVSSPLFAVFHWYPIKHAPLNRTKVLVYRAAEPGYEGQRMGIDWYCPERKVWMESRRAMQPTHFMFLPKPPTD